MFGDDLLKIYQLTVVVRCERDCFGRESIQPVIHLGTSLAMTLRSCWTRSSNLSGYSLAMTFATLPPEEGKRNDASVLLRNEGLTVSA